MINSKKIFFLFIMILFFVLQYTLISCDNYTPEEKKYIEHLKKHREKIDIEMRDSSNSPFNHKEKIEFHPLKYFEPNFDFIFKGKLTKYTKQDTVTIYGTKGEERKTIRYGFLNLKNDKYKLKINVYESLSRDGKTKYYGIWFTDKTTGKESYGVGRYLDFELNPDSNYIYTVDFNYAYNPYCSYSPHYSCAIPTKEDYLDIAIKAGEKRFH